MLNPNSRVRDLFLRGALTTQILFFLSSFFLPASVHAREADTVSNEVKIPPASEVSRADVLEIKKAAPELQNLSPTVKENPKVKRKLLKQRIKKLRAEKKKQFAEMTNGLIKKIITEESVLSKEAFLKPGERNLEECVEYALQNHMPAKAGRERIKLSKQRVVKTLRDLFAEATFEMEERRGTLAGQAFTGNSYHVRFKQPVFRGGNLWHTFLKEQATLRGAEADYRKVVNDLVQKVAETYFDSLRTRRVLEDKQALLQKVNELFAQSKKKWDQGLSSEIEYLNMESLQSQVAHDVEQARQDHELIYLEFQKNLDLDLGDKIELTPFYQYSEVMSRADKEFQEEKKGEKAEVTDVAQFTKPLDDYIQLAYEHRPDLKVESNRLRANVMAKRAAVGKLLPQVNMVMQFGELGESFTDTVATPKHRIEWQGMLEFSWNLGGSTMKYTHDHDQKAPSVSQFQATNGTTTGKNSFSLALLDNLEDVYRVKESQIDIMDQFIKLEEKEREVIKDVKEAYFNFRRAEIQLRSEMKQLMYRERLVKLSRHKLKQNDIQTSEYVQSEKDLTEEKGKLHKAMSDYYVARVALNRAVGIRGLLPIKKWE